MSGTSGSDSGCWAQLPHVLVEATLERWMENSDGVGVGHVIEQLAHPGNSQKRDGGVAERSEIELCPNIGCIIVKIGICRSFL